MNRIDRENLSVLTNSLSTSSPIGLNTSTGTPALAASHPAGTLADDATVGNSSNIIEPKPGVKFAQEENFGTVPVGMNRHGDYTGASSRPGNSGQRSTQQTQIVEPKPGSKFALPEEDECGAMPAPLSAQAHPAASVPDDMSVSNSGEIIEPKPGSKFAA